MRTFIKAAKLQKSRCPSSRWFALQTADNNCEFMYVDRTDSDSWEFTETKKLQKTTTTPPLSYTYSYTIITPSTQVLH